MPHETLIRKTSDITSEIIIVTRNYSSPLITIKIKQDGGKQNHFYEIVKYYKIVSTPYKMRKTAQT